VKYERIHIRNACWTDDNVYFIVRNGRVVSVKEETVDELLKLGYTLLATVAILNIILTMDRVLALLNVLDVVMVVLTGMLLLTEWRYDG